VWHSGSQLTKQLSAILPSIAVGLKCEDAMTRSDAAMCAPTIAEIGCIMTQEVMWREIP
jgi:hypothetical protein